MSRWLFIASALSGRWVHTFGLVSTHLLLTQPFLRSSGEPSELASPWLPSLPVSSLHLHFCLGASARALVVRPRRPELRDRWASGPLTVITDPFPSHHLALDLHSLSSEEEAFFLQSQARELVMIPVQRGHSPWTRSSSNSRGFFCSRCCADSSLLVQPLLEDHKHRESCGLQKTPPCAWDRQHIPDGSGNALSWSVWEPQVFRLQTSGSFNKL